MVIRIMFQSLAIGLQVFGVMVLKDTQLGDIAHLEGALIVCFGMVVYLLAEISHKKEK